MKICSLYKIIKLHIITLAQMAVKERIRKDTLSNIISMVSKIITKSVNSFAYVW